MQSLADRLKIRDDTEPSVIGDKSSFTFAELSKLPESGSGENVVICISDPVALIRTLVQLDGRVDGMLLLSAALPTKQAQEVIEAYESSVIVTDRTDLSATCAVVIPEHAAALLRSTVRKTNWTMTTSGTTGTPKRIAHDLQSLSRTVATKKLTEIPRWGLLYDPTRFAGLQVVLQSLIGGGTLIAPSLEAPITDQIAFLVAHGCTHLSATPSLWRRILMTPAHRQLKLRQVTLGGEIVDQPILDRLRASYPSSRITHIYASTEAGVGFSVTDGKEGFPLALIESAPNGTAMRVKDGILWLKPDLSIPAKHSTTPRAVEIDDDGYICSGDMVEMRGDRAVFLGRDSGIINVGGAKVHPETVERALLEVPGIELAQIVAKPNPITGALVTAHIMIAEGADPEVLKSQALEHCRAQLPREAVPTMLRVVAEFETNAAGKLIRK